MKPYYDEDGITIYHGDMLDVVDDLEPVEVVVTSPPYNMGVTPGGNGRGFYRHRTQKARRFGDGYDASPDDMDPVEYDRWLRGALGVAMECATVAAFVNLRPRVVHGCWVPPLGGDFDVHADMQLRQVITWERPTGIDVNLAQFCTRGEWVMLYVRPGFRLVDHAASGMGDVWRMPMVTGDERWGHPAPFPLALPAKALAATGARSVLDPFMGSGTTLRAAKDAGVRGIGIDTSERYCEMAAKRLAQGALDFGAAS